MDTSEDAVPQPRLVAAWAALDWLPWHRLPLWAAHWLQDGHDGPAMVALAGAAPDGVDMRSLYIAAFEEIGVDPRPGLGLSAALLADDGARRFVRGELDAAEVRDLVLALMSATEWDDEVTAIPLIFAVIQLEGMNPDEITEAVVEEAVHRGVAAQVTSQPPL